MHNVYPVDEITHTDLLFSRFFFHCFAPDGRSKAVFCELGGHEGRFFSHDFSAVVEREHSHELTQLVFLHILAPPRLTQRPNLKLDFEPNSKLLLDLLHTAKAAEHPSSNHYSHFSRQGFCFFHRVGGQDDCALVRALWETFYYLPHKSSCFRVHTSWRFV